LCVIVTGKVIVIMGVSGAGKSTIGKMLGTALSCDFLDADDFHSSSNRERLLSGQTVVLACSSLRKQYREILRGSDPDYKPGSYSSYKVKFVLLEGNAEVIAARLQKRASEGEHFMPLTLLRSQFDLLEADD
ncbi:unnamed protein product, partial [Brassica rapa subsp. trilocularis]